MSELTEAQRLTLKNSVLADPVLAALPASSNAINDIIAAYSQPAAFTVWKTRVPIGSVGKGFNSAELGGLTTANTNRLIALAHYLLDGIDPSQASSRAFFDDIFSGAGGVLTRASLAVLWKRQASRLEVLFATGTGTDASPATLGYEGGLSYNEVRIAMGW